MSDQPHAPAALPPRKGYGPEQS